MISIIDYGAGNLRSVFNAVSLLGYQAAITSDPDEVVEADAVILPGVGAAADTVKSLKSRGLDKAILELNQRKTPLFAVCVGLQVLFEDTEEGGGCPCLGLLPGRVRRLPPGLKVPHMGWNQVKQKQSSSLFEGIGDNGYFYFVHSYYVEPLDQNNVVAVTDYGLSFASMITSDNITATQFHPEKSGPTGLRMYDNFLKTIGRVNQ